MAAVTGAIWKCATNNPQNVERFEELELMNILIQLLRDNSDALDDLQFNPQKMSVLTNGTSTYLLNRKLFTQINATMHFAQFI